MKIVYWRPINWIEGFENGYSVSSDGRVCSTRQVRKNNTDYVLSGLPRRILRPFHNRRYLCVKLCADSREKTISIHRLVARAFIPIPQKYLDDGLSYDDLEVNHRDGDPENNHVENLEWCLHTENMRHAVTTGLIPPGKKRGASPRARRIAMYDLEGNLLKVFPSITDVGDFFHTSNTSHIAAAANGHRYTSFCHIFRYVDDPEAVETKISVPKLPHTSWDQIKRKEYATFRSAGRSLRTTEEIVRTDVKPSE